MKIAIVGFSGSGKSVLADILGDFYNTQVLHLDQVNFLPNWATRPDQEQVKIVRAFLDSHDSWIIDGNYPNLEYWRRMEDADIIIELLLNRITCLCRAFCRFLKYRGSTRPDMADNCNEKFDLEFILWILMHGRSASIKRRYQYLHERYYKKIVVLRNQNQINRYLTSVGVSTKQY